MKHTPGPWTIEDNRSMCDGEFWILAPHPICGDVSIAAVRPGCTEADEIGDNEANARLIAAAPNLAGTLKDLLEYFEGREDVVDGSYGEPAPNVEMQMAQRIREALSKAGIST